MSPASERSFQLKIKCGRQCHQRQRQLELENHLLSPSSPSSSELLIIDNSKCQGDKFVCKFIDDFKAAKDSDAMINCAIQLLSKIAESSETRSFSNCYNMTIKVKLPKKLGDDTIPKYWRQYI